MPAVVQNVTGWLPMTLVVTLMQGLWFGIGWNVIALVALAGHLDCRHYYFTSDVPLGVDNFHEIGDVPHLGYDNFIGTISESVALASLVDVAFEHNFHRRVGR